MWVRERDAGARRRREGRVIPRLTTHLVDEAFLVAGDGGGHLLWVCAGPGQEHLVRAAEQRGSHGGGGVNGRGASVKIRQQGEERERRGIGVAGREGDTMAGARKGRAGRGVREAPPVEGKEQHE